MRKITSIPARKILLISGIAVFALSTASAPAFVETSTQFGLPQVPRLSAKSDEIIFCYREPDAGPEYVKQGGAAVSSGEPSASRSYLIPALEITGFNIALNIIARIGVPGEDMGSHKTYNTDFSTFWDNLAHGNWQADTDKFSTNQIRHPYQGAVYQGFARSAGLNFWESMGYTFLGSLLWETAGETENPSVNDQIATGIAGNFLGEPLYRMASLLLERQGPGFWSELGAAVLSPPTVFNRLAFGDRFKAVFPSHDPAFFWHLDVGGNIITHHGGPDTGNVQSLGAMTGFSMEYGLPGKPGYRYARPFDYFRFEAAAATNYSTALGVLGARGLLFGKEYDLGSCYNGVWGLYGSYDYISTDPVRVSSTAVSIGTTAQWLPSPGIALQGTVLGGVGYGAGGDIPGSSERSYHYGGTVQSVIDLRLILGDLAMLDFKGRQFYISDVADTAHEGSENIIRLELGFTVRMSDRHALGLRYQFADRDAGYRGVENLYQDIGRVCLVYTFLSDEGFGAVGNGLKTE